MDWRMLRGWLEIPALILIGALAGSSLMTALFAFLMANAERSGAAALIGVLFAALGTALVVVGRLYVIRRGRPLHWMLIFGISLLMGPLVFFVWWVIER